MPVLMLQKAVGRECDNRSQDVKALHKVLMDIGKIPCYECSGDLDDTLYKGILDVQAHFMRRPDGVISVNRSTHRFLKAWKAKPINSGVQLPGRLRQAWDWVDPLLPDGSRCTSGYRSAEHQRRLLQRFYTTKYRREIIARYGKAKYDLVKKDLRKNEKDVLAMVRGVGQAIATPGRSAHQKGKAVDIGGPDRIDKTQVAIVKLVAKAHPELFSGFVIKERNGCVHFEIR